MFFALELLLSHRKKNIIRYDLHEREVIKRGADSMGQRANLALVQDKSYELYYTHWGASDLPRSIFWGARLPAARAQLGSRRQ
ncbi:hypothetical protein DCC85_04045 [Paenibacillus sp. CAA11]|nr:hypothetical protein DCC85_04045 [Paenibacillus sp. CAA11]